MELNAEKVIDFFEEQLEQEKFLPFLKDPAREQLKKDLSELKNIVKNPEQQDYFHNLIQSCALVWKQLFVAAIKDIDPFVIGMDDIIDYFDKFVDFEEILYSSDDFYRDHTSHTLWTYFLSEMLRSKLKELNFMEKPIEFIRGSKDSFIQYDQYLEDKHIDEIFKKEFSVDTNLSNAKKLEKILTLISERENLDKIKILEDHEIFEDFDAEIVITKRKIYLEEMEFWERFPAISCAAFLCHDLGYPLKRIKKISKKVSDILTEFNAQRTTEYGFTFSGGIRDFLLEIVEMISREYIIKGEFLSFKKDQDIYMNLLRDSENYEHGLMSAFILSQKVHSILSDATEVSSKINVNNINLAKSLSKMSILKSISLHTCTKKKISDLRKLEDFLIFTDFIEEFSRMTRASMVGSRMPQFCTTEIEIEIKDKMLIFNLIYNFDPEGKRIQELDPKKTFIDKVKFIQLHFDIKNVIFKMIVVDPIIKGVDTIQRSMEILYQNNEIVYNYKGYDESIISKIEKEIGKNDPIKAIELARKKKEKKTKN